MKRILLIIILAVIAVGTIVAWRLPSYTPAAVLSPSARAIPTPTVAPKTVMVNGASVGYGIIRTQAQAVSLIPNFAEKRTSDELYTRHQCDAGINGGFYDTDYRPLGLFTTDGTTLRGVSESSLINGFFSVGESGQTSITSEPPSFEDKFTLQTGPLLITDGIARNLRIKNDEHARRMAAAVTDDDTITFITLYQPESLFDGPLLEDVPHLLEEIGRKEALQFRHAINLDGGSASSFYGDGITLGEITSIGSFFCVHML